MWDQGCVPPSSSPSHTHSHSPSSPYLHNPSPLQHASREQLLQLLRQKDAEAKIYKEKFLQAIGRSAETGPVQETSGNVREGDESLEGGRQEASSASPPSVSAPPSPPAQQPTRVHPDIRMFLPDVYGMRVEQTPPGPHPGQITAVPGSPMIMSRGGSSTPLMAWSDSHVIDTQSMDPGEERKILLQALKDYQNKTREQEERLSRAGSQIHCLLTQLEAAMMEAERMKQGYDWYETERREKQRLTDEVKKKDETICKLTEELQQLKNNSSQNHHIPMRAGVKRGRFFMSKTSTLECVNCSGVFSSQDAAQTSVCAHHPKAACHIPNKMVAELPDMFPEERGKQRYWPCCKAYGTNTPPPCYRGAHVLRLV